LRRFGRYNKLPSCGKAQKPAIPLPGIAHLRETGSSMATWATITDIGLHGCDLEAMSTFAAGANLALTIEVNGFRVESRGEVWVVYPNLGLGISFTSISDLDRERLPEPLRSLTHPSVILGAQSTADSRLRTFLRKRHILSRENFSEFCESSGIQERREDFAVLRTSFTFHLLSRILRFFVYNRVSLEGLLWFSGARLLASPNFDAIRYDEALWRFTSSLALADL
jgi:hypothetical protein